eukprot:TRINITY_DN4003_c0_g1_i3.p1 TRINITY_DN4003_c0_g1~~TRINITY_DN4003_c0_g1_i3.p1  ORF type:complete len:236 (+),score=43.14 TRINITY_DN4003_c0_g1_i3:66-773(+)
MHISAGVGYAAAAISPFLAGTSAIMQRTKRVRTSEVPVLVYQAYVACGVMISCLFCLLIGDSDDIGRPIHYSRPFWGGCIYALAYFCALSVVQATGVSFAMAAICGTATLTSFFWGKAIFLEPSKDLAIALIGILSVVMGVVLFAYLVPHELPEDEHEEDPGTLDPLLKSSAPAEGLMIKHDQEPADGDASEAAPGAETAVRWYMALAVLSGLLAGSSMVPLHGCVLGTCVLIIM